MFKLVNCGTLLYGFAAFLNTLESEESLDSLSSIPFGELL